MLLALDDASLEIIMTAAQPLEPPERAAFLQALAHALATAPVLGPGIVSRTCRELQREFLRPEAPVGRGYHHTSRYSRAMKPGVISGSFKFKRLFGTRSAPDVQGNGRYWWGDEATVEQAAATQLTENTKREKAGLAGSLYSSFAEYRGFADRCVTTPPRGQGMLPEGAGSDNGATKGGHIFPPCWLFPLYWVA